jgi:tetratricopeptide (TPR) repeat protein
VALKVLETLAPRDLEGFRREIYTLSRLRHPGLVRIVDHGIEAGIPWYAMELVAGMTLEERWHGRTPGEDASERRAALRILCRLCLTLAFLHGEGVVHRDLKPGNVLIRADGEPVLIDFGLAAPFGTGREVLEIGGELAGTLAYMAPEQIRGEFVDARADLYSLGCLLYEALTGAPPFEGSAAEVMHGHLADPPVPPTERAADVPAALSALVLRLLAKTPRERIGYALDVATGLEAVLGPVGADEPTPPAASYLYRPSFVGRRDALARVGACLERAYEGSTGFVLVGGESGVGKTRLAMEATRVATQRGFVVVPGECLPLDGGPGRSTTRGAPLHPLRPLLRFLADHCRLAGADATRAVLGPRALLLAPYEPALRDLPGLEGHPAPAPLPPQAERERLQRALCDTVRALAAATPLLLIIDDLQWADELTLACLAALGRMAGEASRFMALGTYRTEETTAELRALAAEETITAIELGRMDRQTVALVVADMLALDAPPDPFVQFLTSQSEGNPFFVSEYLRTAVSAGLLSRTAAGDWRVSAPLGQADALRSIGLPSSLEALLGRRLDDLPPESHDVVAAGAVLGRDFDVQAAAALAGVDEPTRLGAMAALLTRHVLEDVDGTTVKFAHDKLREVAYERIPPERRARLHEAAATRMEAAAVSDERAAEAYPVLAHHFAMAGRDEKAAKYFGLAGEWALRRGAPSEAQAHLSRALALTERQDLAVEPLRRAHWLRLLGDASAGLGDLEQSILHAAAAQRALGLGFPRSTPGWVAQLGRELARRLRHAPPAAGTAGVQALEGALAAGQVATAYYFKQDLLQGMASSLRCIRLAERSGTPGHGALSYAQLGYIVGSAGLRGLARRCFARARALEEAATDLTSFAAGLYFEAMYEMGLAHWRASEAVGREALGLLERIGNVQEAEIAKTIVANTLYFHGRFADSERCTRELLASARERSNAQHTGWGLFLTGRARLALGDLDAALPLLRDGHALMIQTTDLVSLIMCEGLFAKALLSSGDRDGARRVADALAARLPRPVAPLAQCLDGYRALAEVYLALWRDRPAGRELQSAARRAGRQLRRFAWLFPMAVPTRLRLGAWEQWLLGRRSRALRMWRRSLRSARRLGMAPDEALAHLDLAAHDPEAAAVHLEAAERLLTHLGCRDHAADSLPAPRCHVDRA